MIDRKSSKEPNPNQINASEISENFSKDMSKKTVNSDFSQNSRQPILASPAHKDYNRLKYYSALKTGYKHMGAKESFLNIPHHTIDEDLFLLHFPFEEGKTICFISGSG